MLTKPDLKDEKIIACLHDNYGLDVAEISSFDQLYHALADFFQIPSSN